MEKVYIQRSKEGEFLDLSCFTAWQGFKARKFQIEYFKLDDLDKFIPTRDIYIGGLNALRKILTGLHIKLPDELNIKECGLEFYAKRHIYYYSMKEFRARYADLESIKMFVKPARESKLFDGTPIDTFVDLYKIMHVADDTEVLVSDFVEILSEYRVFIQDQSIIGCKNYTGDFTLLPNFKIIDSMIKDFENQPISYSLDIGINSNHETFLIELNDGWAIAPYGLNAVPYSKFLESRWKELLNEQKK